MGEVMSTMGMEQPAVRNLVRTYINRALVIQHKYGNYLRQKAIDDAGTRASLALGVTGSLGAVPSSKTLEKQRRDWIVQQCLEKNVVEDFETFRSHVYKPISQNIEGPYTVREMDPARIQKIIYNGKEIFFGITKENHLVMYSVVEQNGKRQMVVHAVENVYKYQNSTAYLKNKARKTLLELLKKNYNILPIKTSFVEVREAA